MLIFLIFIIEIQILLKKIKTIIQYFKDKIGNYISKQEISDIFKTNKLILQFLFENDILTISDNICKELLDRIDLNGTKYCYFFYPEIKPFIGEEKAEEIENELISYDSNIFNNFDEKRQKGENDSYICSLIRQDSVEEFIAFVQRNNYPLNSEIAPSIFETNLFLIENTPTLIEYSAFFGSIQIFNYLRMNNVQLTPSLWLYSIHSRNPDLIHLLESEKVPQPDNKYESCVIESIKCHHNEIAEYFLNQTEINNELFISSILQFHNYEFLSDDLGNDDDYFFYLCFYHYNTLVNLLITSKENEIKETINNMNLLNEIDKIQQAANENQIYVLYYLLLKQERICADFFYNNKQLTKIAIPLTITSIEDASFGYCKALTHISIPPSVTTISKKAFSFCSSLVHVSIPSSVTLIEDKAFYKCTSLSQISIPSSVKEIGKSAFYECESLSRIELPFSVESIGEFAFL